MNQHRPGRPRLVEEGKPLTDSADSSGDENDVWDEDIAMDHHHHHHVLPRASTVTASSNDGVASSSLSSSSSSSLLKALGGKTPTFAPKRSMRIEIGGDGIAVPPSSHYAHEQRHGDHGMECDPIPPERDHHHVHLHQNNNHVHEPTTHSYSYQIPSNNPPTLPPPVTTNHSAPSPAHSHSYSVTSTRRMHYEVGADYRSTERMEGVEDHSIPLPLVVLDGANVAYAYAHAQEEHFHRSGKVEPDVRGLSVACAYFDNFCRVRVVLPASFMRAKPRAGDRSNTANAWMETDRFEILQQLQQQGKIVASPPTDDDDAYCLTIAQRENLRAAQTRNGQGPAFVFSNDMFRDAQERDASGRLKDWLTDGDRPEIGPGRISFTFVDLGRKDDHGDPIFDLMPNPRHPLIAWIEEMHRQQGAH